jgi:Xaa-Pro aminopeptidase
MLEAPHTRQRQQRILAILKEKKFDAIVLGQPHHVCYASGHRAHWLQEAAFILFADGKTVICAANLPDESAVADEKISYPASWFSTQRQEQTVVLAEQIASVLRQRAARRIGIDASAVTSQLLMKFGGLYDPIDTELFQVRRSKLPDELALMRKAIDASKAMYCRARQIIEVGLPELELFAQLHAAAVQSTGEPMTAPLGNDYACGVGGGPARAGHVAQAGQLWILDLGPSYRGYFADNARVFSVDRKPTDAQLKAWQTIVGVFPIIEKMAKPGVRCRDLYAAVEEHFQSSIGRGQVHHLGHGVGLQPHEFPHLNPKWDDVLIEGEVFTSEPGLYGPEINGGIRIENQYLVTGDGVENLVEYEQGLTQMRS